MKFLRLVKRCHRRDHIREINEEIRSDLDNFAVNERIKAYRRKLIQHIDRMEESRVPKRQPRDRRKVGRPNKKWAEE